MELAFTPGFLRGEQFLMEADAGKALTLLSGAAEMSYASGECFRLENGFAEHNNQRRMTQALPQYPDRFTVYLTCYTPGEKSLSIRTGSRFPLSLQE